MMQPKKFVPHPFTYHQELEVRIENLTNEGSGVARVDGWVVFVPFALPGELQSQELQQRGLGGGSGAVA